MKEKVLMLVIGILIGAIVTAGGFLIFGGNGNKGDRGDRNFDPSNMKNGSFPGGFSDNANNIDFNNIDMTNFDPSNIPTRPNN